MTRIFVVYGHHNTKKSFNASIRDTFIDEANKLGHEVDLINLHDEKQLPFFDGTPPSDQVLNYRQRLEKCDVMFLISPCYNLRASAILENWIDLVLAPKWFFSFKRVVGNWGYPVAGAMKNKLAIMSMSYGGNIFSIQTWFQNMPFRRIKAGVLKLGGMKIKYARFYEVLPGMKMEKFNKDMEKIRKLVRQL
ncbi:NAD(P)H-dependent oxidoreductase [Pelagibacteraceae bacterium]|jgi:NAD(P)H dehydrogenase (quinone)|nr:NAD(P)H-dependent oxidoreductase [Pelagibacteraceae bacterium]|tara:strand:+ start:124 stop:699 length:576 start_codon:yes stop_codon:yes gene_type:complete